MQSRNRSEGQLFSYFPSELTGGKSAPKSTRHKTATPTSASHQCKLWGAGIKTGTPRGGTSSETSKDLHVGIRLSRAVGLDKSEDGLLTFD